MYYRAQLFDKAARKPNLASAFRNKSEQFKLIGLSLHEYSKINEILEDAISTKQIDENLQTKSLWNISKLNSVCWFIPYAVTYNVNTGDNYQYNVGSFDNRAFPMLATKPVNSPWIMNNSSNFDYFKQFQDIDVPGSTNSSRKNTFGGFADEFILNAKSHKNLPLTSKIDLVQRVLEGITDESQVLITSKPKNKSQKIRRSNRHSRFRGVSLNGKKWQVMIMGLTKKKYFGGIASEREAAVFYDKLSIITNGLAAKTNFNYRKCDLQRIMAELEYMEPLISN